MKKLFFNEDGTIKVVNTIILVDIIVAVILLFMVKNIFGTISNAADVNIKKKTTTTATTKAMNLCNGCKLSFKTDNMDVNPGEIYIMEDYLNLEKVNMQYVKFEISDSSLAKIINKDGKVALEIANSIGKFTLKASYYSQESSIEVNINSTELLDITFDKDIYYVKNGGFITPQIELVPKGFKIENFDKRIENIELAEFDSEGNIIGKKVGKTNIIVTGGNITRTVPIYVVNSNIDIKVKENFLFRDIKNISYDKEKTEDKEILLILENTNLSYQDVKYEVISDDNMIVSLEYTKKNTEYPNAYEYLVKIADNRPNGGATIIFTIPDGSKKEIRIEAVETNA